MQVTRTPLLLLAALVLGAATAEAQSIPSPIRYLDESHGLGVFAGYLRPNPHVHVNDSTTLEIGPQAAPIVGARYQLRFGGPLAGHVAAAYTPAQRNQWIMGVGTDTTAVEPVDTGEQVAANLILVDAGLHFGFTGQRAWHGLAPYAQLLGGLVVNLSGASDVELRVPVNERFELGPSFALGAAIGTDIYPTDRLSLRVELSNRLWRMTMPAGFTDRGTRRSEWNSAQGVTVGAAFHF
jgi:hypothetical protein